MYGIQSVGYYTGNVTLFSARFDTREAADKQLTLIKSIHTINKLSVVEVVEAD